MMFNLFYTLFKYKEKSQNDELGNYPEKVHVRAFPERRFLWTSRFFVILSCLSICLSMLLGSLLTILVPLRKVQVMPLRIDYELYQVTEMERAEKRIYVGNLVSESLLAEYVTKRYTIGDSYDELKHRLSSEEFIGLSSDKKVYTDFDSTERVYAEYLQQQGIRRRIEIERIYPVSFDFWQVRFKTIDTAPNMSVNQFLRTMNVNLETVKEIPAQGEPLISRWIATVRMRFNTIKYENKDVGLRNPYGLKVISYDLSYIGNNLKSFRK